jgi:hypothetical protein
MDLIDSALLTIDPSDERGGYSLFLIKISEYDATWGWPFSI